MAVDIGPKIGIDGEAKYRQEINQIITQAKTLSSEMKKVESEFGKEAAAQDKAAAKAKVLNKQIETQRQRVEKLAAMYEKSKEVKGEDAAESLKWAQALNNAQAELNQLERELKKMPSDLELTGRAFQESGRKIQAAGDAMSSAGQKMTRTLTAPLVALGTAAVKIAADFDSQMSKVAAISGAAADEMQKLTDKARELGASTKFSATEVGQAYEYMAMAGWKTGDMLDGVAGLLDLAAASGEDLASVSDIVTDALTGFGKSAADAQHFADVMAAASSNANTNVAMMGETFKYVAPVAGALAYSIEDTALAVGLMANSGIKASQAGTSLRSILSRMASPAEATADAMAKIGVSLTDEEGNMKSMRQVIDDLRAGFSGLSETERAQVATAIAGKNAMSALLAIVGATEEDYNKLADAIDNANGTASDMAKTMQDNLGGRLTALKSKTEELAIGMGNALMPTAEKLVASVGKLVDWLNTLDDEEKDQIIRLAGITAAAGPVVTAVGKTTSGIGKLVEGAGKLTERLGTAAKEGSKFATALATAGPLAAGMAVTAGALALAFKAWKDSAGGMAYDAERAAKSLDAMHEANTVAVSDAETLANRVRELSAKESLSAQEKLELASAVERLNSVMPDLNLSIDQNTGNLDENSKALLKNIDASLAQYKAKKNAEELAEITEQYAKNEERLMEIQKERAMWETRRADPAKYGESLDTITTELNDCDEAERKILKTQEELSGQYDSLVKVNEDLTGSTEDATDATKSQEEAMNDLAAATTEDADAIVTAEEEIAEAYQKAYEAAYSSLSNQQGLFDEVKEAATASATEMAENLGAQSEAYANYAANLVEASRMASESSNPYFASLVQSIADMGMDGAGYLQELITAAQEDSTQLDAILANYGNMEQNKNLLAQTMAEISTGTAFDLSGLTESVQKASNDVNLAAVQIPENMASGMDAGTGTVQTSASQLAKTAANEPVAAVKAEGPDAYAAGKSIADNMELGLKFGSISVGTASRKLGQAAGEGAAAARNYRATFYQVGSYLSEGFALGMESQLGRIRRAAAEMASAADEAVRAKGKISSPSKVMMELGQYMGEGFAIGMENMIPEVTRAGSLMAGAAVYAATPGMVSGASFSGGGNSYDYGGFNIVVNGAPGQNVNALADVVSKKINNAMRSRRQVFA